MAKQLEEGSELQSTKKLYIRGLCTNSIGVAILYLVASKLGLSEYVLIAAGIQLVVFLFHGKHEQLSLAF